MNICTLGMLIFNYCTSKTANYLIRVEVVH